LEILEEKRKVRISSHKSLFAIFRDLTLDQWGFGEDVGQRFVVLV